MSSVINLQLLTGLLTQVNRITNSVFCQSDNQIEPFNFHVDYGSLSDPHFYSLAEISWVLTPSLTARRRTMLGQDFRPEFPQSLTAA